MNVTVTPEAQEKIAEMCVENDMVGVRAFIYGGGCATDDDVSSLGSNSSNNTRVSDDLIPDGGMGGTPIKHQQVLDPGAIAMANAMNE